MVELKRVKAEDGSLPEEWTYELYKVYMLDKTVKYVVDVARISGTDMVRCYGNTYFDNREAAFDAVSRLVAMLADPHFSDSSAA